MTLAFSGGMLFPVPSMATENRVSALQAGTCTGFVKDASGEAVTGAFVAVKGTNNGAVTGLDGEFSLDNVPEGSTLVISFVGNTPSLFPGYIDSVARLGFPVYRAIGNHDMTYGGCTFEYSFKTFESFFGPCCFSFNKGKAHYIVLDNNFYVNRDYQYIGYIDERTFAWMEEDLKFVPEGSLVFVVMHIPGSLTPQIQWNALLQDETSNVSALYDMLKGYNAHIISGHTHFNLNVCPADRMIEHNTAAVCGIWWKADICMDGTPIGYGVYEVNGNDVVWRYKSAGYSDDYQMRTYPAGRCAEYLGDIVANVWNWDDLWKVEWLEDGKNMGEMIHFTGYDPDAEAVCADKERVVYDWISPVKTEHLFRATPKNPDARIEVRVTDRFGNVYRQAVK